MNLTKRMLQFMTVCAGVCALNASAATQFVADSFEYLGADQGTTNGVVDMPIAHYRCQPYGTGLESTNFVWISAEGDASKLVAVDAGNLAYAASSRPMTGVESNLVLNLETEGQTLTRTVDGGPMNFVSGAPVYVDTLIKFTPSEDDPVIEDTQVKAAVFVNVESNLVVYCNDLDLAVKTQVVTEVAINPEQWYRLTILMSQLSSTPVFKVYLDGTAISSAIGYDDGGSHPGEWFASASVDPTLNAVAFQGTGMIDELVVSDEVSFGGMAAVMLTLSFDDALMDVTQGATTLAPNDTVEVGSTIAIDAIDWYEIASVTGDGVVYTGPIGSQTNTTSGDLTMVTPAETTVTITAQYYTGAIDTGLGAAVDATKLSAWAVANSKSEAEVIANAASWMDDYLLNVAPDTDATIQITSIVVDETGETATITVGASTTDVHLDQLNGTLVVYTTDELGVGFGEPTGEFEVTVEGATESTVVVNFAGGKFIKAVVK